MANISTYLAAIMAAVYGEDVRGSIHDAIEIINDVSEVVLSTGTAVTSASSSSEGYYDNSLYLNTNTMELWKCVGTDTWQSQGTLKGNTGEDGNGIVSVTLSGSAGLVDTYEILFDNGNTTTFDVTNGADGENGNKWYRGTGISGKSPNPTVYSGSGVTYANPNDFYLNPSEGAVYYCNSGGDASTATWTYDFTMTGGGGGGVSDYPDLTNLPQINGVTLVGNKTSADLDITVASLDDTNISTPSDGQALIYDGVNTVWKNASIPSAPTNLSDLTGDVSISTPTSGQYLKYNGSKWANANFPTIPDGLADLTDDVSISTPTAGQYLSYNGSKWENANFPTVPTVTDTYSSVSHDGMSGVAVASAISGKADDSDLDEWTQTTQVSSGSFSFSGLDDSHGYGFKPFVLVNGNSTNKNPSYEISSILGAGTASMSVTYTTDADENAYVKLRIIK